MEVPVSVKIIAGEEIHQPIKVTLFRESWREKAPYLILNHGRPTTKTDLLRMKRQRYVENARYFVSLGFVVLVPTRVGYGESGGPDVENAGSCHDQHYAEVFDSIAAQTAAVLQFAAKRPYVDLSRGVVVGQSFGGMGAIALSTMPIPGLLGTVNFSGGSGGHPVIRSANPCSADQLAKLLKNYGAHAQVPTLWLYTENDRYWGPDLPKTWFREFTQAGGKGEFVPISTHREEGHLIFLEDRNAWAPPFEAFLQKLGFPIQTRSLPAPTITPAEKDAQNH